MEQGASERHLMLAGPEEEDEKEDDDEVPF